MDVSGELHAMAALPPGKEPPIPIGLEARWTIEPLWKLWEREKKLCFCWESNMDRPVRSPSQYRRVSRRVCHGGDAWVHASNPEFNPVVKDIRMWLARHILATCAVFRRIIG
jgi:hypothetical protein